MGLQVCNIFFITSFYIKYHADSCSRSKTQSFPRSSHKNLKGQELVHLKSVYKILLWGHRYLEIYYMFQNL